MDYYNVVKTVFKYNKCKKIREINKNWNKWCIRMLCGNIYLNLMYDDYNLYAYYKIIFMRKFKKYMFGLFPYYTVLNNVGKFDENMSVGYFCNLFDISKFNSGVVHSLEFEFVNYKIFRYIVRIFGLNEDWEVSLKCDLKILKFIYFNDYYFCEDYLGYFDIVRNYLFMVGIGYVHRCENVDIGAIDYHFDGLDNDLDCFAVKMLDDLELRFVYRLFRIGFLNFVKYVEFIVGYVVGWKCCEEMYWFVDKCCGLDWVGDRIRSDLSLRLDVCMRLLK